MMYVANWMQMGYPFLSIIQIPGAFALRLQQCVQHGDMAMRLTPTPHTRTLPNINATEFLNIIGAALYIASSFYYNNANAPIVFGTDVNGTAAFLCTSVRTRRRSVVAEVSMVPLTSRASPVCCYRYPSPDPGALAASL